MKALELTAPRQVALTDRERVTADSGAIVLNVEACGICGTDIRIFGHGSARIDYPRILGHEIVGTIRQAPASLEDSLGARVVLAPPAIPCGVCEQCSRGRTNLCRSRSAFGYELDGGFAEEVVVPAHLASHITPAAVPEGLPAWLAALAEPVSCCLNGQRQLGDLGGGWAVIFGAGFIGRAHHLLAKHAGARTLLVDPDPSRLEVAGADSTVDAGEGAVTAIREIVGDDLEAIIIATSAPGAHDVAAEVAVERTKVLLFAGCSDPGKGWPVNLVHYKELQLFGSFAALPGDVSDALTLLAGPLASLADDVERVTLDRVPALLDGGRPAGAKAVVELR